MRSSTWTLSPLCNPSAFAAYAPAGAGVHAGDAFTGSSMAGIRVGSDWLDNGSRAIKPPSSAAPRRVLYAIPSTLSVRPSFDDAKRGSVYGNWTETCMLQTDNLTKAILSMYGPQISKRSIAF